MRLKMQREHDPEPERYYDWMLWKMRQEKDMEDPVDDVTVHNQLTKWTQKRTTVNMTTEEMYRRRNCRDAKTGSCSSVESEGTTG